MSNAGKEVNEYREKLWFFTMNLNRLIVRKKDCVRFLGLDSYKQLVVLEKRLANNIYAPPEQDILDILEKPYRIVEKFTDDLKEYSLKIISVGYHSLIVRKTILAKYE